MNTYLYEGPVLEFGRLVQEKYKAETTATSESKARSNLTYRWKAANNRLAGCKVTLPGKIRAL